MKKSQPKARKERRAARPSRERTMMRKEARRTPMKRRKMSQKKRTSTLPRSGLTSCSSSLKRCL